MKKFSLESQVYQEIGWSQTKMTINRYQHQDARDVRIFWQRFIKQP